MTTSLPRAALRGNAGHRREDDNGVGMSACRINLAYIADRTGRHERAEELLSETCLRASRGQARCEATSLVSLAETLSYCNVRLRRSTTPWPQPNARHAADPCSWSRTCAGRDPTLPPWVKASELPRPGVSEQAETELDAALETHEEGSGRRCPRPSPGPDRRTPRGGAGSRRTLTIAAGTSSSPQSTPLRDR